MIKLLLFIMIAYRFIELVAQNVFYFLNILIHQSLKQLLSWVGVHFFLKPLDYSSLINRSTFNIWNHKISVQYIIYISGIYDLQVPGKKQKAPDTIIIYINISIYSIFINWNTDALTIQSSRIL